MALDATKARVGITGAIYGAPLGSTAPTDATTALAGAYVDLGYISEDGIEEAWDDSVTRFVAWQNATVIRSAVTDSVGTLKFTMLETKRTTLENFYRGSTVTTPSAGNYKLAVKPIVSAPKAWVFDVVDGAKLIRTYVGNGEITERGSVMWANGEMAMYPVTLTFYPDANGDLCVKYSNDAAWVAA
jgi:hypothetical protein